MFEIFSGQPTAKEYLDLNGDFEGGDERLIFTRHINSFSLGRITSSVEKEKLLTGVTNKQLFEPMGWY